MRWWTVLLLTVVACTATSVGAAAEPVEVLRNNGPDENRVNVVILGDGYTREELAKYADDVEQLLAGMFLDQPFADYASYFNVRRVDVTSNESGADHPADGVYRDTALGAHYDCANIPRLICVDYRAVLDVLDRSVPVTARDIVLVLVNDDEYGGAGGPLSVASTNSSMAEIMLHEVGHSFGLLADEYTGGGPQCNNSVEPPEVNVTRASTAASIKWSYWIEPGTPVPSTNTTLGVVSAYEGARYCESGLYRPTFSSKMRDLERPFEQVNTEQLIGRIYNLVSPIDAVSPATTELQPDTCESLDFSVTVPGVPDGLPGTLQATWSLDGDVVTSGNSLYLFSCAMTVGVHRIELEVRDVTTAVRQDPAEMLVKRFRWDLAVTLGISRPGRPFTDDPIRPGVTTVRAIHFTELRDRIDSLRREAELRPFRWTDPVLRVRATPVRLAHLLDLRAALDEAFTAAGWAVPVWSDASPGAGTTPIRAVHLMELRAAVVALE